MEDGVRFIFKTLIKVPILILISYFLFNIFSFTVAYFRLYSAAQTVCNVVMENNYVPTNDVTALNEYMKNNVSTRLLVLGDSNISTEKTGITVKTRPASGGTDKDNERVQYGGVAEVTVRGHLVWLLPLMNVEGELGTTAGLENLNGDGHEKTQTTNEALIEQRGFTGTTNEHSGFGTTDIEFTYQVPCLKYYSDLKE